MGKAGLWAIAGVAVITLLYLVYLAATFEPPEGTTTVVVEPPTPQPIQRETSPVEQNMPVTRIVPTPEPPAPAAEPVVEPDPLEVVDVTSEPEVQDAEVIQLPTLNDSDAFVFDGLRALENGAALLALLADEQLIRRFVVFVHNVSQGELPQTDLPYRAVNQEMPVREIDENLFVMDESAHDRFDGFVSAFAALEANQAMALYQTISPLFQQAYAEIGFRNVEFNATLRRAINLVLSASQPEGPFQLVKPSVMYLYADSSIEDMDAVDKQLIRLGPENTAVLKDKLREFLELL